MTKPHDVPEAVWRTTLASFDPAITPATLDSVYNLIARAILAERERIAEWCEVTADAHDAEAVLAEEEADVVENRAAERALRSFANAIRKGGA
jgi:hypothetical protein